ncbi:MAG: fibronectin type III domain-containing protein, partial [Roseburia sp.]
EQGYFQGSTEGAVFDWLSEDPNCENFVTIEQDGSAPNVLHVNITDAEENIGWWIPIAVRVSMPGDSGMEEVAYQMFHLCVCNDYYCLENAGETSWQMAVGESEEVTPELWHYVYKQDREQVTENIRYRWEWDTEAVEIKDSASVVLTGENATGTAPFTITKLKNRYTNANLIAELQDQESNYAEVARRNFDFTDVDYSVWFEGESLRGDEYTWIYADDAEGETYTVTLNDENLRGRTVDITWYIGIIDENGEYTDSVPESSDTYEVSEDKKSVTLHANGIRDALGERDWYNFNLRAVVSAGGEEVSRRDVGVDIRNEVCDYSIPEGDTWVLPAWGYSIGKVQNVYVENAQNPYGANLNVKITSVEVANAPEDTGEGAVATVAPWEDGNGWNLDLERLGDAVVTITYQTIDGSSAVKTLNLHVVSEMYVLDVWSDTGCNSLLPGAGMDLTAEVTHCFYNEETGEEYTGSTDGITYGWSVADENCNEIMTMEQDGTNPAVLHVSTNANSSGWWIPIEARAFVQEEEGPVEVAYRNFDIQVCDSYYQLFAEDVLAAPGEHVDVPVVAKKISLEHPGGVEVAYENIWVAAWDNADLIKSDINGTSVYIETGILNVDDDPMECVAYISAEIKDESGNSVYPETTSLITVCEHRYSEISSTPSTCTVQGSVTYQCDKCGTKKTESQPLAEHKAVKDAAVAATCTTAGKTEGSHCSVCGKVLVAQQTIPAKGHTEVKDAAVAATCTKAGKTEGSHCSVCGVVIKAQQTVAATGHTEVKDAGVAATCTKAGKTEGSHCSVCGVVIKAQQTIAATGHDYKEVVTPAEIGKDGSIVKKCSKCGDKQTVSTIAAISSVELSKTTYVYNEKVQKPSVTVKDSKGKKLAANTDYTVSYPSGCKNPGKYTVTIKFKGNYKGTKTLTYTISPKAVSISKITAEKTGFKVTWKKGAEITGYQIQYSTDSKFKDKTTASKTVSKSSTTSQTISKLKPQKKYYVRIRTYKTIKVDGKEQKLYSDWSAVKTVITADSKGKLSAVKTVTLSKTSYTYNGKECKPSVTVKDAVGNVLEQDTDYTVSYSKGCKTPGKYTVTVTFTGNYSSTKKKTLTYTINPKSVAISTLTASSKGFKVTWKKGTEITGYEIQYSTSSKFTDKTTKTVTVKDSKTTSKSISKLSAKKKYYVRIRTYKTVKVDGKSVKVYSSWSDTKNVTTKK